MTGCLSRVFSILASKIRVPDARTIWLFHEKPTKAGAIEKLFAQFGFAVREAGYISIVRSDSGRRLGGGARAAQHRRREAGDKGRPRAKSVEEEPARLCQKDRNAQSTVKFSKAKLDPNGKLQRGLIDRPRQLVDSSRIRPPSSCLMCCNSAASAPQAPLVK
jgi:hypothetical protein